MNSLTLFFVIVALFCLMSVAVIEFQSRQSISIFDLQEFKELPYDLRLIIKPATLSNVKQFKNTWNKLDLQQKQMITQGLSQAFSVPIPPPQQKGPPAPSHVVKPSANRINETQKENTENEKEDKVVTLSDVGASDDEISSVTE